MTRTRPPEERFWPKVDKSGDCWEWTARKTKGGYGRFTLSHNKQVLAHRFAYEEANGPIPDGMQVDHLCFKTSCVRPEHMRLVTNKQNGEHQPGAQSNSKSGIRGVCWDGRWSGAWRVQVRHNKRLVSGGSFRTREQAEAAAIALRNELFTHNDVDRSAA